MNVLFLDIDGVLNSHRTALAFDGYPHDLTPEGVRMLDPVALGLLRCLCESMALEVVISSSWRIGRTAEDFRTALDLPAIDCTPSLLGPRGKEINAWLDAHPQVQRYAILDDDGDMLPEQLPCFVKTDISEGMVWRDFERLCSILGMRMDSLRSAGFRVPVSAALDWSQS